MSAIIPSIKRKYFNATIGAFSIIDIIGQKAKSCCPITISENPFVHEITHNLVLQGI
jgi:hypothetical protein